MKNLLTILTMLVFVMPAQAKTKKYKTKSQNATFAKNIDLDQQMNNLGTNDEIIKKARALQPNNSMSIVQKRQVDRNLRPEIGLSYGFVNGGDSYVDTRNWGANLDFHINPRWSLGLRYNDNRNELTSEGQRVFDAALAAQNQNQTTNAPSIDFPLRSYMAMISWYPIYGKVSWFESAVSQFDFYVTVGGGQVELNSGSSPIYTGGVGMGMWLNSWLTSRVEVRYQNYQDRVITGERNIDSFVMQIGIGIML
jgi:outer membrane immunogenic protein